MRTMGRVWWDVPQGLKGQCLHQSPVHVLASLLVQPALLYQAAASLSPGALPSPQTRPSILLCLQLKVVFKERVWALLSSHSVLLGPSHVNILLNS